jgi:hypothetical protein
MVEAVGGTRLRNILFRKCRDLCWLLLLISLMGLIDLSLQRLDRASVLDYKLENDLAAIRPVQCEGKVEWALNSRRSGNDFSHRIRLTFSAASRPMFWAPESAAVTLLTSSSSKCSILSPRLLLGTTESPCCVLRHTVPMNAFSPSTVNAGFLRKSPTRIRMSKPTRGTVVQEDFLIILFMNSSLHTCSHCPVVATTNINIAGERMPSGRIE